MRIVPVWWCTWDSTLKDTEITDVVRRGSIHPPPTHSSFLSSSDVRSPLAFFFFFFLGSEITNNVLVTYFSLNSFSHHLFLEQVMYWAEGEKYWERKAGGEKGMLDSLCETLPGIRDTFNKRWRSVLVDDNRSTSRRLLTDSLQVPVFIC